MNKYLGGIVCLLAVLNVILSSGCTQDYEQQPAMASELQVAPSYEIVDEIPEYVSGAIDSTGGRQLWIQTEKIEFDCVVTFYRPDGSYYLTEQHHEIEPWSNCIRITALEPQGKFACRLSPKGFNLLQGAGLIGSLAMELCERSFAEAMLDITTVPVRFLDRTAMFTQMPSPVKKQGRWYNAIERIYPVGRVDSTDSVQQQEIEPHWSKVVFYQNRDTSRVDMFWYADVESKNLLAVRAYNYRRAEDVGGNLPVRTGVLLPAKIEIFTADSRGDFQNRLVKIDVRNLFFVPFNSGI